MSLSWGPTLASGFLVHFEKNWLQNFLSDVKPHYYRRYVDDIFVLNILKNYVTYTMIYYFYLKDWK